MSQLGALNGLNLLPHQIAGANHMDATANWIPQLPPQQGLNPNSNPLMFYQNTWAPSPAPSDPPAGYAASKMSQDYASREYGYDMESLHSHLMMHQRKQLHESVRM